MTGASRDGFVHLHVHTEYSMLDGAARLKDLFKECERQGMPAIAMTDHGNMYGAYDFWNKATKAGITPIVGTEAYLAPESRLLKQPVRWGDPSQKRDDISGAGAYTHMTLLAQNTRGMHNLFKLSSQASLDGYFRKPRMDRELLAQYAEGIVATTGCPSGEVQTRLRLGQRDEARRRFEEAARLDPGAAYAFDNLCRLSMADGHTREAITQCHQAEAIRAGRRPQKTRQERR